MGATPFEAQHPATQSVDQGEEYTGHTEHQPGLGSPIRIQVWLRRGLLGPAWAAFCGALASGGLTSSTAALLRLALLVFLVDVVWGGLWSALAATDWATALRRWQGWRRGSPARLLPYTSSRGPAGHLARTLGHLSDWWAELAGPTLGPTLGGFALLLPLALVIAGVLGARPFLLTLAAVALLQFVFVRSGGDASPRPGPLALFEITLPWLAGHALFDQLTFPSAALALAYALSFAGGLRMIGNRPGLGRWNLGQISAVLVLIAARQPLTAGISGGLFIGQAIIQPGLFDVATESVQADAASRFLRFIQPWMMAAMLAAAWGVRAAAGGG